MSRRRSIGVLAAATALVLGLPATAGAGRHEDFVAHQENLVSDVAGMAALTDPDLVNPWGLSLNATSPLWVSNAGTRTSTLYASAPGSAIATKNAVVRPTFPALGEPTGQVANTTTGFVLTKGAVSGPARFLFVTLEGQVTAWNPQVDGTQGDVEVKAAVPGAVYTGAALVGDRLYAADFSKRTVDVFDNTFAAVPTTRDQFRDSRIPNDFAPFNVQNLGGNLFVAYAKVDPRTFDSVVGNGLGFVDEFSPDGVLLSRVAARQSLNSPWGLATAPASWGNLAGALLIGNFGDGRINVVLPNSHGVAGLLRDNVTDQPLKIPGLWALQAGNPTAAGPDALWFSAGIDDENHGLLGILSKP
ncbi:TIGR03118 family protein [Kutzneria sp. NPDC052558]|uniref:TIGR03118 family protein n=1 Tax=Kutzneria sp. NPDC052558 TaxID=3364121 RepID=UPI0037C6144D